MAKTEAKIEELVDMIERGKLRLPETQCRYVWRSIRVRDQMDSPYRSYPSGAVLDRQTKEDVPLKGMAAGHKAPAETPISKYEWPRIVSPSHQH